MKIETHQLIVIIKMYIKLFIKKKKQLLTE